MTKEELQRALECAERCRDIDGLYWWGDVVDTLKTALEAKDEPVAYGMWDTMIGKGNRMMYVRLGKGQDGCTVPLYTTPPQPIIDESAAKRIATALGWEPKCEWVGLTDEQIDAIVVDEVGLDADADEMHNFARAIEVKIKEKNT